MKLNDVDLTSPDAFLAGVPYDYFRFLREEEPLSFSPRESDGGFWNIVRHADIQACERNVEVFSSRGNVSPMDVAEAHLANTIDNSIIMTDPPATGVALYATGVNPMETAMKAAAVQEDVEPTVSEDRDDGIQLVPLATATLKLGIPAIMPGTPRGMRMIVDVESASWKGRVSGSQLGHPSGDWAVVDPHGALNIDVRTTLETDDGALIYVRYEGRSDYSKAGKSPMIIAPLFETNDPRYLWLNKIQAIGKGRATGMTELVYEIYEVR